MSDGKTYTLNNGKVIPAVGFGTFASEGNPGQTYDAALAALRVGYRHLDCAWFYQNEGEVGDAIRDFLKENSSVKREDIFVCTKVWNHLHKPDEVKWSLNNSLEKFGLDYIDLFLVHWPIASEKDENNMPKLNEKGQYVINEELTKDQKPTWGAMEELYNEGKAKAIGVSNWTIPHLKDLLSWCKVKPTVNQIEVHPFLPNEELVKFCFDNQIMPAAYSPLGSQNQVPTTGEKVGTNPGIPLSRPNKNIPSCPVTVMCYNVLCEKYATTQMYGYCPSWALSWDYRKKVILGEIRHYTADIITLQEVETDQFYNFFLPELKKDGYDGVFSPKSRAKTMSENDRKRVDGCAIFFRAIKFTLIKEHLIEFNQLAMANSSGSDDMLNRVMPRDNIGLAALLKTNETAWENSLPSEVQQPILVCTAHIHWDPEFCDVKLIQIMMLSNELNTILEDANRNYRNVNHHQPPIQLLLCGDFNSLPDSGVIEFLSAGKVSSDHQDFKDLQYKTLLHKISTCDRPNEFMHSFKLSSAYENIMPFTNYTFNFKGIIDYIFYTRQTMTPLGLLGPLAPEWFKDNKVLGCPHPHIPSDHFPLLVEFELSPNAHQNNSNGLIGRR